MEWVTVEWLTAHGYGLTEAWAALSDEPLCTDPLIGHAAWHVNDGLPHTERQRLVPIIPRLMRCHTPRKATVRQRVRVRVACWATRSVLDLISGAERRAVALRAIETVEAWLLGEATQADCARSSRLVGNYTLYADGYTTELAPHVASATTYAAAYDAEAVKSTAAGIAARAIVRSVRDPVLWLDDLLDQWEKACVEEGCVFPSELRCSVPLRGPQQMSSCLDLAGRTVREEWPFDVPSP
jgi:hypothetical protein